MSLQKLADWAPFHIDALGLVTIFGADEVNKSIGNLVHSWVSEYLPVLATFVIASNDIVKSVPGFVLYNITDGILATDIAPWFTRWLQSYPLNYAATTITLKVDGRPMPLAYQAISIMLGILATALLVIFTAIMRDGWGIANSVSMIISVAVRQLMLHELRSSIDRAVDRVTAGDQPSEDVKVFLTLPDGRAVTIFGSRKMITDIILTDPRPLHPRCYLALRLIAWLTFGAHAISLGMSTLFSQILAVIVLLLGTFLAGRHVGDCKAFVGNRLRLEINLGNPDWTRAPAYARLSLTETEEQTMVNWNLFPQGSNKIWWDRYRAKFSLKYQTPGEAMNDQINVNADMA